MGAASQTEGPGKRFAVILVDDSEHDRLVMGRALSQSATLHVVWEACDGEEAISYLRGLDPFANRQKYPLPDILILDLKMPCITGHEVLQWIKTQPFDDLLIVVLSGSSLPEDIAESFSLGADAYYKKSAQREDLETMVREIEALVEKL